MIAAILNLDEGARTALQPIDQVTGGFLDTHDVVDAHLLAFVDAEIDNASIGIALQLFGIAENEIDLVHPGKSRGFRLGGAAGDDDAGIGIIAPGLTDRLTRLTHGLVGDRAGIDQHSLLQTRSFRLALHHLRLIGIEPAAKGYHIDGHEAATSSAGSPGAVLVHSSVSRSISPSNSTSVAPVIST